MNGDDLICVIGYNKLVLSSPRDPRDGPLTLFHTVRSLFYFFYYPLIYELLLLNTSHNHHMPLGNVFGDISIPISSTVSSYITRATNKEIFVGAFWKTSSQQIFFLILKI